MIHKNFVWIVVIMMAVFLFDACRKNQEPLKVGGCGDANSPEGQVGLIDYDDGSCLYGFITEYQITYHPQFDNAAGTGVDWDFATNTDADLILRIKQDTASDWFFNSESGFGTPEIQHNDTARFSALTEYQLVNTSYRWDLYDHDPLPLDDNDLISSGTFNAIANASDGYVTAKGFNSAGDSTELRIKYDLRKVY
ncbi:MAG: hypothetical protein P8M05_04975 [Flavobacteriales bacterium]|nr:hypothetical protein [Flavobacteriales bacterium]